MPPVLAFDIETLQNADIPYPHIEGERLPAAPHWTIVCIGAMWLDENLCARSVKCLGDGSEQSALVQFAELIEDRRKPTLLGFNSRSFDAPIIEARLMHHGIPCPRLFSRDIQDRYYTGHVDLCDVITNRGAATKPRLDAEAKLVGFPGKLGCDGSQVAELVAAGRLREVQEYCCQDVAQMVGVHMRREYVRGALSLEAYRTVAQSLLALIDSNTALEPLRDRTDRVRFLCT